MAGINPNLGKNLKLQNLQLNSATKVDVNKTDEQQENIAKPSAVWFAKDDHCDPDDTKYQLGDVLLFFNKDSISAYRRVMAPDGSIYWRSISTDDIMPEDYEANRGDFRTPLR